jgi:pimeloyl-ACP methyl ester carboxylesterase
VADVSERTELVGETEILWREAPGSDTLYLHGVPTDGDDWLPFLEQTGGYAPDLPGFGRSG